MSKRTFAEFDGNGSRVFKTLEHVNELLAAAQALKRDLEQLQTVEQEGNSHGHSTDGNESQRTFAILRRHSSIITSAVGSLAHDELECTTRSDGVPYKTQKLVDPQPRKSLPASLPVPSPTLLTSWRIEDIPSGAMPPLPPVMDPALEKAALTHSGKVAKSTDMSYERLEWIGDAYLYVMSTAFISQTFPNLATGRMAQLREKLVKNETLSVYSLQYGLNKRAEFPAEFDLNGRQGGSEASQKQKKKVLGDIFESYVAAMILGSPEGLSRVASFMKALWASTLCLEIKQECMARERQQSSADGEQKGTTQEELNPKVVLARTIGSNGVIIKYTDLSEKKAKGTKLPWYTVGVYLDGWGETNLQLGYGSGLSKRDAGAKAAQMALENKKLMRRFGAKREELLAAVAAQKQQKEQQQQ